MTKLKFSGVFGEIQTADAPMKTIMRKKNNKSQIYVKVFKDDALSRKKSINYVFFNKVGEFQSLHH